MIDIIITVPFLCLSFIAHGAGNYLLFASNPNDESMAIEAKADWSIHDLKRAIQAEFGMDEGERILFTHPDYATKPDHTLLADAGIGAEAMVNFAVQGAKTVTLNLKITSSITGRIHHIVCRVRAYTKTCFDDIAFLS